MKCSYCRKDIDKNNHVKSKTDYFCNNLCKYSLEKDQNSKENKDSIELNHIVPEDLKFHLDLPNFKFNKLVVRGSHFGYPKLYFNDKKVKPYKGRFVFVRNRKFRVRDDDNQINEVNLHSRFLDAIPLVKINNDNIELISALKWYQYAWISIPAILLFIGGGIGALLGTLGTLTNSVIFRKFNLKIAKYLLTGVNSLIAFIIFFKIMFFIWPITTELLFNKLQQPKVDVTKLSEDARNKFEYLTSTGWYFKGFFNEDGFNITDPQYIMRDSKRYFNKSGKFQQVFFDGSIAEGTWSFSHSYDSISINFPGDIVTLNIGEITSDSFVLNLPEAKIVHIPYKFDILTYIESYF